MRVAIFFILVCYCSPVFSLLPPLAQSLVEMKAVLSSKELYSAFDTSETIQEITRVEDGFLVITEGQEMFVAVHYDKISEKKVGPQKFSLEFHSPRPFSFHLHSFHANCPLEDLPPKLVRGQAFSD